MVTVGLLVRLEAKPGREQDVEDFLKIGLSLVLDEPDTLEWFAIRLGPQTFGILDAFPDDDGRQAHLSGPLATALLEQADDLLSEPPTIEMFNVLAVKE
jgi:quinol monooxygenase YgiN